MVKGSGTKTARLNLSVTPEEKTALERMAAAGGYRSVSDYVGFLARILDDSVQGHVVLAVVTDCGRLVRFGKD